MVILIVALLVVGALVAAATVVSRHMPEEDPGTPLTELPPAKRDAERHRLRAGARALAGAVASETDVECVYLENEGEATPARD